MSLYERTTHWYAYPLLEGHRQTGDHGALQERLVRDERLIIIEAYHEVALECPVLILRILFG